MKKLVLLITLLCSPAFANEIVATAIKDVHVSPSEVQFSTTRDNAYIVKHDCTLPINEESEVVVSTRTKTISEKSSLIFQVDRQRERCAIIEITAVH